MCGSYVDYIRYICRSAKRLDAIAALERIGTRFTINQIPTAFPPTERISLFSLSLLPEILKSYSHPSFLPSFLPRGYREMVCLGAQ